MDKVIDIVESEKTAVIGSVYKPKLILMATSGVQNLNARLLNLLMGRRVILFPDVNQFEAWKKKARYIHQQLVNEYKQGIDIVVSDLLERSATPKMKEHGADLADILIKRCSITDFALADNGYPVIWDL